MRINLAELDAEPSNLDLVVRSSRTLDEAIRPVPSQIASAVHAIPNSAPVRRPVLAAPLDLVDALHARSEPVLHKLLGRRFCRPEVPFRQSSRTNVDLSNLAHSAKLVPVVAVDDEELNVDHPAASGHDVLARLEERRVGRESRDGEVGDGALGLGRAKHVDDLDVVGELLEARAVALGEDVADEESVKEGGDRASGLRREELSHRCSDFVSSCLRSKDKGTHQG